jgi:hypothetical protein
MTFPSIALRIAFDSTPLASGSWVLGRSELGIDTRLGYWDASAAAPDTYPAVMLAMTWTDNYPTVLYTLDMSGSPPVWAENRTGLPDVYYDMAGLRVDPADVNRAWVMVLDTVGSVMELYRNTSLTTGGAWTKVYDLNDWLTDLGYPGGVFISMSASFDVSQVDPDLVGILIGAHITHGGNDYRITSWVHSHDGGTIWTRVNYSDDWDDWALWFQAAKFGRETAERLYIMAEGFFEGEATEYVIWVSDDHGHTVTGMIEVNTNNIEDGGQPVPVYGDDDTCYFIEATDGDVHLTTDGVANIARQSVGTGSFDGQEPASSPEDDGDVFYAYRYGDSLQYTLDLGATILTHVDPDGYDIHQVYALHSDMVVWAGLKTAGADATKVKLGSEATYVDKTGNIDAAMADGPIAWCYEIRMIEIAGAPGVDIYDDLGDVGMTGSTRRGRQNDLQRIEAGVLDVQLLNLTGNFWPAYAGSIYYPDVLPAKRAQVRVTYSGVDYDVYTGYIERWVPKYIFGSGCGPVVDVQASDFYKFLAQMLLNDPAGYAQELSGTRIDNLLDDLGIPDSMRDLDVGQSTIIATGALANVNALEHLHLVQDTEQGTVFQAGDGDVIFQDRHARLTPPLSTVAATFGDGVGDSKFRDIELEMSDALVFNDVRITRESGTEQVASDGMSQQDYGYRTYQKSGLLMTTDAIADSMAEYLLSLHKDAHLRVLSLVIDPEADPADLWPKVLGYDLGTKIHIHLSDCALNESYFIEGIEHRFPPGRWETKWWLSPADPQEYWVLDTSELGIGTRLAY